MAARHQSGNLLAAFHAPTAIQICVEMERMGSRRQTGQVRRYHHAVVAVFQRDRADQCADAVC